MRQQGPPSPVQTTQSLLPQQPCFDGGLASLWGRPHARPGPSRTQMACARMASNSPLSMEVVTLVFLGPRTRVPRQKLRSALSTHQVMVTCPQLPPQSLLRPQKTPHLLPALYLHPSAPQVPLFLLQPSIPQSKGHETSSRKDRMSTFSAS